MEDVGTYILWPFILFYGLSVYFVAIWNILWLFGIYFPVLVCCTKKNLATLLASINFPKLLICVLRPAECLRQFSPEVGQIE
jgi:hypothetical protein